MYLTGPPLILFMAFTIPFNAAIGPCWPITEVCVEGYSCANSLLAWLCQSCCAPSRSFYPAAGFQFTLHTMKSSVPNSIALPLQHWCQWWTKGNRHPALLFRMYATPMSGCTFCTSVASFNCEINSLQPLPLQKQSLQFHVADIMGHPAVPFNEGILPIACFAISTHNVYH